MMDEHEWTSIINRWGVEDDIAALAAEVRRLQRGVMMDEQELAAIIGDLQHWDSASPYRKEGMADIFVERFKNHTLTLIAEVRRLRAENEQLAGHVGYGIID